MQYVLTQTMATPAQPIGGKAKSLAILGQADAPVPEWMVITPEAFFDSLSPEQREALGSISDAADLAAILSEVTLKPEIQTELEECLNSFFEPNILVAVRSSAMDEDQIDASFAGQLQSFLFVPLSAVADKVLEVWRSGFTEQVMAYRAAKGMPFMPTVPAVLVQKMVNATVSGVAFGANPVSGTVDEVVISGLYGLGTALVSGEADADVFYVHRKKGVTQRNIANKKTAARYKLEAIGRVSLCPVPGPDAIKPCLTDAQLALVAQWVRYAGLTLGTAQDMEWAFVGNRFYILQSRPVTTPLVGDPNPYFYYWDDDDLDSWTGVTTPLTFSFIQRFYAAKFMHLSKSMGVSPSRIFQDQAVYDRILGLVQGRITYNVSSLEEVWAAVPGFQRYRSVFNDWIGMAGTPVLPPPPSTGMLAWLGEHLAITQTLLQLGWTYWRWDRAMSDFYRHLNRTLALSTCEFGRMNMDRLAQLYQKLETTRRIEWGKPTINNFFASFFYTRLAKLTRDWCGDNDLTLQNNLLCADGGIFSTRPVRYFEKLATLVAGAPELMTVLCEGMLNEVEQAIALHPEFYYHYQRYMLEYGQRCHESSLLESPNIVDEPLQLLRSVGYFARRLKNQGTPLHPIAVDQPSSRELEIRQAAEAAVRRALNKSPVRRIYFNWVLKNTRARVRDRENIRFFQTLVIGRLRQIVMAIGYRFKEKGLLQDAQDIIYLEVPEILGFIEGTATCTSLNELALLRKQEFSRYRDSAAPPSSFETLGSVYLGERTAVFMGEGVVNGFHEKDEELVAAAGVLTAENELAGISCSPGKISGPVCFVGGGRQVSLTGGEILVAELGDPGLVMLFPAAAGLLFEKGSPLSHLSIVAREMGIPTIVSIPGLRAWLHDGEWIEMDGKTGVVRKTNAQIADRH